MTIRILLADDHELFLAGLHSSLEQRPGMTVVQEVKDGLEAVQATGAKRPDVVVMDVSMPGMNGIEATRRIVAAFPTVKVLALSLHNDRHFVASMLEAGASGYAVKEIDTEELLQAVRTVAAGGAYLSPKLRSYDQRPRVSE